MGKIFKSISDLYERILNNGTEDHWSLDRKRSYRQVNAFNLYLCITSASAWPIAIIFNVYSGLLIQLMGFMFYLSSFYFLARKKLESAREISILTFEVHMFIISLFAVIPTKAGIMPYYSPVFISFMLFPLTAALFDRSVLKHGAIAIMEIIGIQFIGSIISTRDIQLFPPENYDILNLIVCFYTIGMGSLIISLIYNENQAVKNLEMERARQLEMAIAEVNVSKDLIQKQADELKVINNAKNKFFSIIAHDLKSPYNTVLGFSELLKNKDVDDPEYNRYAKEVYDTALINYNFLENLLEWSRTQMDHFTLQPKELCLAEKVTKCLNLLKAGAEKKDISIISKVDPSHGIRADKNLVSSILRNIISNAIKFTGPGGTIIIDSAIKGSFIEVSVSDNGIGMPQEILRTLFTIETTHSRKGTQAEKGTGLGLILCKEFIDKQGGKIWAESKENEGTVFRFTFPLVEIMIPVN